MNQENPKHLPPEALDNWLEKVSGLLGIEEEIDVGAVLDLTSRGDIAGVSARLAHLEPRL